MRSTVMLADASGKARLTLTVDRDGNPRIEFLDGAAFHDRLNQAAETMRRGVPLDK